MTGSAWAQRSRTVIGPQGAGVRSSLVKTSRLPAGSNSSAREPEGNPAELAIVAQRDVAQRVAVDLGAHPTVLHIEIARVDEVQAQLGR